MAVHYKLESFEGPLDLLLSLIDKAEVDIYNIPISQVTDQYMEYLNTMQAMELDITSEFLVMAATLLALKSKLLLPKPPVIDMETDDDDDLDPRAALVQQLIEYRIYKGIAEHLREKELAKSMIYSKEPEDLSPFMSTVQPNPVIGLNVADLVFAFQKVLRRSARSETVASIRRDEISVKDRIAEVLTSLQMNGGKLLFSNLFSYELTRGEIVVTFLALLEMMKLKKVSCYQHSLFDNIVIQLQREEGVAPNELSPDEGSN